MSEYEVSEESSDELQDILAEYETKAKEQIVQNVTDNNEKRVTKKPKTTSGKGAEVPMDKVIFGDKEGLLKSMATAVGKTKEESSDEDDEDNNRKGKKRKPVWRDADDEEIEVGHIKRENKRTGPLGHLSMEKSYKDYLTRNYKRIVEQPKWASLEHKVTVEEDSEDEEILKTVGFLAKNQTPALGSHYLKVKQLRDLNRATYAEGPISSVQFHPTSTAALVSGERGIATIYSIDGYKNEKLHSMRFQNFKISCAKITPCGTKAIFGSQRQYYYAYDLMSAQETRYKLPQGITNLKNFELSPCGRYMAVAGRFGEIFLFDAKANELIQTLKQNDLVRGMRFTADSKRLISSSIGCDVNIFSLREQRLEHSFIDEGCIKGNALDLSPNQRMLATGSREGVVNIYDFDSVYHTKTPQPEKRILNLTTSISDVKFNHSSELLGICSSAANGAMRCVHFPSGTVYANFPAMGYELNKVRNVEFSPSSGFMALGTQNREVSLFRLKHFKNY